MATRTIVAQFNYNATEETARNTAISLGLRYLELIWFPFLRCLLVKIIESDQEKWIQGLRACILVDRVFTKEEAALRKEIPVVKIY